MIDEFVQLFFEQHEKDFVKSLPCLGMSCGSSCPYYKKTSFGNNVNMDCMKTFKEDWIQYSRKKKLEKLLS